MRSDHRFRSLDSLRGIAATLVVFFHVNWDNHLTRPHFFRQAFLFVDLFFILSGFIIMTVYGSRIRNGSDAASFMIRRFFRLYPLHLATLCFLVTLELLKFFAAAHGFSTANDIFAFQRTIPAIFVNLAFLQGAGVSDKLSWNTPSWSISCEMIAYAVFSFLAAFGLLRSRLFWLAAIPILGGYSYIVVCRGTLNVTFDVGVVRCLCGFFLGSLLARIPEAAFPNLLVVISTGATLLMIASVSGVSEIAVIPVFGLLVYALRNDESSVAGFFLAKPLVFLGKLSFSIYLVHYLVISLIGTFLKVALHATPSPIDGWDVPMFAISPILGDALVTFATIATFLIAILTYEYVETPGRNLGYRLTAGRAKSDKGDKSLVKV